MSDTDPNYKLKTEFAELLQRNQAQLFSFIHSLLRDWDDAEDLFQQTSIILWRRFDQYDRQRSFLAWACGVARLEGANYLRSRSSRQLQFTEEVSLLLIETQTEIIPDEMEQRREALSGCIEKLRQGDRDLLEECYYSETDVNEIAQRSGRVPQSIHNSLRRIRQSLFECIHRTLTQRGSTS